CGIYLSTSTASSSILTLSLHDALPIFSITINYMRGWAEFLFLILPLNFLFAQTDTSLTFSEIMFFPQSGNNEFIEIYNLSSSQRSEEHTSELQSRENLVCRLLLEKKHQ